MIDWVVRIVEGNWTLEHLREKRRFEIWVIIAKRNRSGLWFSQKDPVRAGTTSQVAGNTKARQNYRNRCGESVAIGFAAGHRSPEMQT